MAIISLENFSAEMSKRYPEVERTFFCRNGESPIPKNPLDRSILDHYIVGSTPKEEHIKLIENEEDIKTRLHQLMPRKKLAAKIIKELTVARGITHGLSGRHITTLKRTLEIADEHGIDTSEFEDVKQRLK